MLHETDLQRCYISHLICLFKYLFMNVYLCIYLHGLLIASSGLFIIFYFPFRSDPFQAKPKIPRTPDSLASNRSRPVSGDVPLPTRSVSPPVPKPSSRGQGN